MGLTLQYQGAPAATGVPQPIRGGEGAILAQNFGVLIAPVRQQGNGGARCR